MGVVAAEANRSGPLERMPASVCDVTNVAVIRNADEAA